MDTGNRVGSLQTARRRRRRPGRRHSMCSDGRAAYSLPAISIAILRRVAAPTAAVSGQFRPGNFRHGGGAMRSCRNCEHHSERPAGRTPGRCSDAFNRAPTSDTAESPCAPSNRRWAFEGLAGPSGLLALGMFVLVGRAPSSA